MTDQRHKIRVTDAMVDAALYQYDQDQHPARPRMRHTIIAALMAAPDDGGADALPAGTATDAGQQEQQLPPVERLTPSVPPSPRVPAMRAVPAPFRTFVLRRDEDVSGVSGTGIVAEGVQFSDGSVALRWFGDHPSTACWGSIDDVEFIHGHKGLTVVAWVVDGAA